MKIILNSDILLSLHFAERVIPAELAELCRICSENGIVITLPETTLLEFDRRHAEFAEKTVKEKELEKALSLLKRFSIEHEVIIPREVVKPPDLQALLKETGVTVEVVAPSCEDLREAHLRACKHLPPSMEKKSDEMRDIVIWLTALGIATRSSGALLIAADALFHDVRANDEAQASGLTRVRAIENAIDHVRGLRPAPERFASILFSFIWDDLVGSGIDIPDDTELYRVTDPAFTSDETGLLGSVTFRLAVEQEGRASFKAQVKIEMHGSTVIGVSLTDVESSTVHLPNNAMSLSTNRTVDLEAAATTAGLRDVVGFGDRNESEHR